MEQLEQESAVKHLVRLGMARYQAKMYASLCRLGPAAAAEAARAAGVPRTKAYQVLDELVRKGAVEFLKGSPTVYRAVAPQVLVRQLREGYSEAATKVVRLMRYERARTDASSQADAAWIVKGWGAIRRKLAETLGEARKSILMVEAYPSLLSKATRASLKACRDRGVTVRAVSIVDPRQDAERDLDFVEYRRLRPTGAPADDRIAQMFEFIRSMQSGSYTVAIVDDVRSFIVLPDRDHGEESLGISLRIPGVPALQRILAEGVLSSQTSPM